MSWLVLVLVLSGMLEAVWASALSASEGMRRPRPTALFVVALALSMAGLGWAMQDLPTGTAYAVWVGIGATLTVVWGFGPEPNGRRWRACCCLGPSAVFGLALP